MVSLLYLISLIKTHDSVLCSQVAIASASGQHKCVFFFFFLKFNNGNINNGNINNGNNFFFFEV